MNADPLNAPANGNFVPQSWDPRINHFHDPPMRREDYPARGSWMPDQQSVSSQRQFPQQQDYNSYGNASSNTRFSPDPELNPQRRRTEDPRTNFPINTDHQGNARADAWRITDSHRFRPSEAWRAHDGGHRFTEPTSGAYQRSEVPYQSAPGPSHEHGHIFRQDHSSRDFQPFSEVSRSTQSRRDELSWSAPADSGPPGRLAGHSIDPRLSGPGKSEYDAQSTAARDRFSSTRPLAASHGEFSARNLVSSFLNRLSSQQTKFGEENRRRAFKNCQCSDLVRVCMIQYIYIDSM